MAPSRKKAIAPATVVQESSFSIAHFLFLILLLGILGLVFSMYMGYHRMYSHMIGFPSYMYPSTQYTSTPMAAPLFPVATRTNDALTDPYFPPLKTDIFMSSQMPAMIDVRGMPSIMSPSSSFSSSSVPVVPVNIPSRGFDSPYTQIGILNRADGKEDTILPLMGKPAGNGRDKYNYYTISNTGNLNTKLPIRVKGKSGIAEYGCDEVYSGDTVFVDGYNAPFRTTVYDNAQFRYLPAVI